MAIHANHPGLTVEVMVDDEALPEYVDNEDSSVGNEVIRYIEARSGAEFEIWYTFDEAFPTAKDVGVLVDIDGKSVDDAYFSRQESHTSPFATQGVEMKIGSNWVLQCLSFVDLQITEESCTTGPSPSLAEVTDLGTIRISLRFGSVASETKHERVSVESISGPETVSEVALKGQAKTHTFNVCRSEEMETPDPCADWEADDEPFAVFLFKYRSLAALKSLGIVPRTPSPEPVPAPKQNAKTCATPKPRLPTPTPAAQQVISTPTPRQPSPTPAVTNDHLGLTIEEIIAMISIYRGHDTGLSGQSTKSLLGLLKYYENKDTPNTPVKNKPEGDQDGGIRIKRERDGGAGGRGRGKKAKAEVIVIDD